MRGGANALVGGARTSLVKTTRTSAAFPIPFLLPSVETKYYFLLASSSFIFIFIIDSSALHFSYLFKP